MNPTNLHIITDTDKDAIASALTTIGGNIFQFTNGTYAYPAKICVPTTLAGFQFVTDQFEGQKNTLVIAVNSNSSMVGILNKKNASDQEFFALEPQIERGEKVGVPLALLNPGRPVAVIFYDEETPTALYDHLAENGIPMCSLYKWGYGLDPNGPKIEGAHNFGFVFAFPLPNETPPLCHDITDIEDQSDSILVMNLMETDGKHGKPYLNRDNQVLFPVPHALSEHKAPLVPFTPQPSKPTNG